MQDLLARWNPIGKTVTEVKRMLGAPSEQSPAQLTYRFDNGFDGNEWLLAVKDGKITRIEHNSTD